MKSAIEVKKATRHLKLIYSLYSKLKEDSTSDRDINWTVLRPICAVLLRYLSPTLTLNRAPNKFIVIWIIGIGLPFTNSSTNWLISTLQKLKLSSMICFGANAITKPPKILRKPSRVYNKGTTFSGLRTE